MATQAHCAYCFESLAAALEKRVPLSLSQTQALWKQYHADPSEEPPTEVDEVEEPSDSELEDPAASTLASTDPSYRPAAISRLLAPSPGSASSSSVQSTSSTPSGISEASSATSVSSKSPSSSPSSFFSLGKRLRSPKDEGQKENAHPSRRPGAAADAGDEEIANHPLFVTWNILQKNGEKRLRGCIGTFEPQELDDGLRTYALTSAFDDTRFDPIHPRELPTLETGVTLLTNFESITNPMDWTIGTHGLRINFTHHGRRYGSTYLPDVAKEQGWTKEETLFSLMRKAGWNGRRDDVGKVGVNVTRYQGRKVELAYGEWKEWRDWVAEGEAKV